MRAQRLLSILMQLQVNRRITARELAQKLESLGAHHPSRHGCAERFRRAGNRRARRGRGWSLLAEYETKLTGLSPAEIQSLFISRAPKRAADLGLQQESEGAWTKLQFALSFGADVEVVEPVELRGRVREAALAMLGVYKYEGGLPNSQRPRSTSRKLVSTERSLHSSGA
jgi:predicted DNA-binding transcriptional regulator YafY